MTNAILPVKNQEGVILLKRKSLQITYLIMDLYPGYINKSHNLIIKQISQYTVGRRFEEILHPKNEDCRQTLKDCSASFVIRDM